MKKQIIKIINVLLIIFISMFIFSVAKNFLLTKKTTSTYKNIQKQYEHPNPSKDKFKEMKTINNDYKFWINIENTNINYPVVQTHDNDYYLKHDFKKSPLKSGSIFLDNTNVETDFNQIIFGHNMKNETMFSSLTNFKEKEFFNQNNKIIIEDENFKYTYEVFSVYAKSAYENFDYLYNINQNNLSENDKIQYLESLKNSSIYTNNIQLQNTDKILTLITCSYEFEEARTFIHAKLIDKTPLLASS